MLFSTNNPSNKSLLSASDFHPAASAFDAETVNGMGIAYDRALLNCMIEASPRQSGKFLPDELSMRPRRANATQKRFARSRFQLRALVNGADAPVVAGGFVASHVDALLGGGSPGRVRSRNQGPSPTASF